MRMHVVEQPPQEAHPQGEVGEAFPVNEAALVAIGGLGTVKQVAEWYAPLLKTDTSDPELPWRERFIVPAKRGVASPDAIHERVSEDLEELHDRLGGRKMWLAGHSLGALIATKAAYERPDLVAGVSAVGGVHKGYKKETVATFALRRALGNPKEAAHLRHNSPFMQDHEERMATEWPEDTPLDIISTPFDALVVPPQGYDVELANSQQPDKRLVVPSYLPGTMSTFRRIFGISEDVQPLKSRYPTEHVNIIRNPDVIRHINASRGAEGVIVEPLSVHEDTANFYSHQAQTAVAV